MVLYDTLFKVLKYALDKVYKKEIYRHLFRHLIKSWKILICLKVPKIGMVRIKRLELPCLSAPDPKSGVSTNFTISAHNSSKFCEAKAPS